VKRDRGKTMSAVFRVANAIKAPFFNAGRAYNQAAQKSPATTGIVTTLLKTSAADWFAQKVSELEMISSGFTEPFC
jgi:hypothetical protein